VTRLVPRDRQDQTRAVIASLFDVEVGVGVTDPRQSQPALMGTEAAHLTRAIDKRKAEFAAGRAAARSAMQALDITPGPIPAHADRSPIWPDGIRGSISHKDTLCAAVITRAPVHLGLDIEENTDLDPGLLESICISSEIEATRGGNQAQFAKLIFCAKEAAYKAQYPITRQLFGFDHMEITLDVARNAFTATFVKPVGVFAVGDVLPGRFDCVAGHLVTAVTARQGAGEGA
jgi:4'-phosphopantetheinyl transferase EntD